MRVRGCSSRAASWPLASPEYFGTLARSYSACIEVSHRLFEVLKSLRTYALIDLQCQILLEKPPSSTKGSEIFLGAYYAFIYSWGRASSNLWRGFGAESLGLSWNLPKDPETIKDGKGKLFSRLNFSVYWIVLFQSLRFLWYRRIRIFFHRCDKTTE